MCTRKPASGRTVEQTASSEDGVAEGTEERGGKDLGENIGELVVGWDVAEGDGLG